MFLKISDSVHVRENTDTILFIYGKVEIKKSPAFRRGATQRFSYQIFDQNRPVSKNGAGYKRCPLLRTFTIGRFYRLINL